MNGSEQAVISELSVRGIEISKPHIERFTERTQNARYPLIVGYCYFDPNFIRPFLNVQIIPEIPLVDQSYREFEETLGPWVRALKIGLRPHLDVYHILHRSVEVARSQFMQTLEGANRYNPRKISYTAEDTVEALLEKFATTKNQGALLGITRAV